MYMPPFITEGGYTGIYKTMLGQTQAPQGMWHPSMALLGLIPHLDDVIAALDASVSKDIRDLYSPPSVPLLFSLMLSDCLQALQTKELKHGCTIYMAIDMMMNAARAQPVPHDQSG